MVQDSIHEMQQIISDQGGWVGGSVWEGGWEGTGEASAVAWEGCTLPRYGTQAHHTSPHLHLSNYSP